jgi:hypothetical protein
LSASVAVPSPGGVAKFASTVARGEPSGCRPNAIGPADRPGGTRQSDREPVVACLVGRRPDDHAEPDAVVACGERGGLEHPPAHAEGVQLASGCLHRVGEERLDVHGSILRGHPNR